MPHKHSQSDFLGGEGNTREVRPTEERRDPQDNEASSYREGKKPCLTSPVRNRGGFTVRTPSTQNQDVLLCFYVLNIHRVKTL